MWPFRRRRTVAKLRAAYTRHLADEIINELVNNPEPYRGGPEPTELCFMLLQVRDDPVERAPAHLARAFDIIKRRDGMVWGVMSSMALATFGFPFSDDPDKDRDRRAKSVARLVTEIGPDIRLIHGTVDGLLGSYGAEGRLSTDRCCRISSAM